MDSVEHEHKWDLGQIHQQVQAKALIKVTGKDPCNWGYFVA
jgi:hypothetical protein